MASLAIDGGSGSGSSGGGGGGGEGTSAGVPSRSVWAVEQQPNWTSAELAQLEKSLFHDYDNTENQSTSAEGLIQIAGPFPTKCVRDIAVKARQITQARSVGSLTIGLPSAAACVPADKDSWIQETLKENIALIEAIRDNLRQNRVHDNAKLYERFRTNVREVSEWTDGLGLNLPPMSVRMTKLFDSTEEPEQRTIGAATKLSISTSPTHQNDGLKSSTTGLISPAGNPMQKAVDSPLGGTSAATEKTS